MKAKDKAKKLVDDMFLEMDNLCVTDEVLNEIAKNCALIAVNEILKSVGVVEWDGDKDDDDGVDFTNFFQYWEEVKQEIIKL